LTAIEIDPRLADSLRRRLQSDNLVVVEGDATRMPFPENSFSSAVCFTMLHHIPSAALQDQLLSEVYRALKPDAIFAGSDSMTSLWFRLLHIRDTMTVVDPNTFGAHLERAGFCEVHVEVGEGAFRFRARKPLS
jgi:ubiquinone/menaquinone biosynthesis C-methylase UbiE